MSMMQSITEMSAGHFWMFSSAATLFAGVGFYFGFHGIRRARLIEDVPTAKVRSAHQGYVELEGTVAMMEGAEVIAPLSKIRCCWYRYRIEVKGHKNRWNLVRKGVSDDLFLIRDETGECLIDPDHAEVTSSHKDLWYGRHREFENIQTPAQRGITGGTTILGVEVTVTTSLSMRRYRYTEEVLLEGDGLYAIGHFKTLDDIDHLQNRSDLTRTILRDWKQNQATLMARFDHNRDGRIDNDEWQDAQRVAARQASVEYKEQLMQMHHHTLSRPPIKQQPYLISNLPQFDLVSRYRRRAVASFVLFFVAGAGAVTMYSARFFT